MLEFLQNNLGTILVALALVGISLAIIIKAIKNKKQGKSSCGCNCSGCSMASICHKKPEDK